MKLIIQAYQIRGWIADFHDNEAKLIKEYGKENGEIETLFSGPNEEELIRDILKDEYYDLFENHMDTNDDYAIPSASPILNSDVVIQIQIQDELQTINISEIETDYTEVKINDWKNENSDSASIAYSFGYISSDLIKSELELDVEPNDFCLSKLKIIAIKNEFFNSVNHYIQDIEYDGESLDLEEHTEDFEGDYFTPTFVS
tara:strand:+ start:27 stop:629 length:603 start_codon:yes stop_codon:yes gene_type:complete